MQSSLGLERIEQLILAILDGLNQAEAALNQPGVLPGYGQPLTLEYSQIHEDATFNAKEECYLPSIDRVEEQSPAYRRSFSFPSRRLTSQGLEPLALLLKVATACHTALTQGSYITKRGIYYEDPHLFGSQATSDAYLSIISGMVSLPRLFLGVIAASRGLYQGDVCLNCCIGSEWARIPESQRDDGQGLGRLGMVDVDEVEVEHASGSHPVMMCEVSLRRPTAVPCPSQYQRSTVHNAVRYRGEQGCEPELEAKDEGGNWDGLRALVEGSASQCSTTVSYYSQHSSLSSVDVVSSWMGDSSLYPCSQHSRSSVSAISQLSNITASPPRLSATELFRQRIPPYAGLHIGQGVRCVLVVEKETIFQKLAFCSHVELRGLPASPCLSRYTQLGPNIVGIEEDVPIFSLPEVAGCVIVTSKGYPNAATRHFLHAIQVVRPDLPMLCLVDADPDGIAIYLAYRFGTRQLALDCPFGLKNLRYCGLRITDIVDATQLLAGGSDDDDMKLDFQVKASLTAPRYIGKAIASGSSGGVSRDGLGPILQLTRRDKSLCQGMLNEAHLSTIFRNALTTSEERLNKEKDRPPEDEVEENGSDADPNNSKKASTHSLVTPTYVPTMKKWRHVLAELMRERMAERGSEDMRSFESMMIMYGMNVDSVNDEEEEMMVMSGYGNQRTRGFTPPHPPRGGLEDVVWQLVTLHESGLKAEVEWLNSVSSNALLSYVLHEIESALIEKDIT